MHDAPMAAYNCDGLSKIATKPDKPMMQDSYTSDMFDVPKLEEIGYTKETIRIECGCKSPRFIEVNMNNVKGKQGSKQYTMQFMEHKLPKSKSQLVFHPKTKSLTYINRDLTSKDTTTNAATTSTSSEHGNSDGTNLVTIKNSFEVLKGNENIFEKVVSSREDNVWDTIKEVEQVMEESDSDEVEDV
ncbi:hypothetical protein Tco_0935444 [Tanacetum coccineum]